MDLSEPKLISPMLDGFAVGAPFSDHNGVRCCPAIREDTAEKYIIKIISIPASQVQLDALLLTGAFPNRDEALRYFQELADGVTGEVAVLNRLSKLEGFLPCQATQIVPKEGETGLDVYLLSTYQHSIARQMQRAPLTHLGAINLGLDLCAALAICRKAGYLYVDLKPSNIFISDDGRYRIGDLGFLPLDSLKYASLPDKYRSCYTPPEISDAMSALNDTLDVYALGLVLYQVYNNGQLPFETTAPQDPLPPPLYADYELAEIILKACALDPAQRWQNPLQMGQALVSYMQRNSVNDTPIVPPAVEISPSSETEEDAIPDLGGNAPETDSPAPDTPVQQPSGPQASAPDETIPTEESAIGLDDTPLSEETSAMLAQADELIAHPTPEPVVAPEVMEIPAPPLILPQSNPAEQESPDDTQSPEDESTPPDSDAEENLLEAEVFDDDDPEESEDEEALLSETNDGKRPRKHMRPRTLVAILIAALLLCIAGGAGFFFYENYYLQPVQRLEIEGTVTEITVKVTSNIDESLLTAVCTDTYGQSSRAPVAAGIASFTGLNPDTSYRIQLEISGFHKLTGSTSGSFTTAAQTQILNLSAVTGTEDGSAILSFTPNGPDAQQWNVRYSAAGEQEQTVACTGHTATITGLTPGTEYTFTLVPSSQLYLTGEYQLKHTASVVIYAQELTLSAGIATNSLQADWKVPEGANVESWTVRCHNDSGYDKTIVCTEPSALFEGTSPDVGYTVDVTAQGMSQCVSVSTTANPITVTGFQADASSPLRLQLNWSYNGEAPAQGWDLLYAIDGSASQQIIKCSEPSATIEPLIPGAHYSFTLQATDGTTVFGGTYTYDAAAAASYQGHWVAQSNMTFAMCKTPETENWTRDDLAPEDYKTSFAVGEKASFLAHLDAIYQVTDEVIVTLFVVRDSSGALVSANTQSRTWDQMWENGNCELNIPAMPTVPGTYTMDLYFNGATVGHVAFNIE